MFYVSFFIIFITLFHLNESVYFKVDTRNPNIKIDPIIRRYLSTITQLSERFPGRAIEVQLQLEVPKRNLVPIPSIIKRHNLRSYNTPRQIKMLRSSDVESLSSADTSSTTTVTAAAETNPITVAKSPIQPLNHREDPDNVPIYLDDLKKAFEEFENKALHSGNNVEFNVPRPAHDGLNWLQVKLPNVI